MRIEKVIIQNINSLAGRFEIDFSDARYLDGLFAITGPSGAGKTTVLDAISLALYGKTPRIDTISETQDEIMSKNRDECAAEVIFVSRGKRYKASFSHQRARGAKPFRQVKREILEYAADGTASIAASMIKEAAEKIVEITGLTYAQFTRSIMLAQFQFTKFLEADSNDRAAILEQISDMEIYRDISAAVYERAKREKAQLDTLRTSMLSLKVLDEEHLKALEDEKRQLAASIESHNDLRDGFKECRDTVVNIQKYKDELTAYEKETAGLGEKLNEQTKRLQAASVDESNSKLALATLQKTLKTVRELDGRCKTQKADIARINREIEDAGDKTAVHKRNILKLLLKYLPDAGNDELKSLYDTADAGDKLRSGAREELNGAKQEENDILDEIKMILQGKDEAYWRHSMDALRIELPLAEARDAMVQDNKKLAEQRRTQKELLERDKKLDEEAKEIENKLVYARLEERFGQERRKLVQGKPCPLCGATEHPSAEKPYDSAFLSKTQKESSEVSKQKSILAQELADSRKNISDLEKSIEEKTRIMAELSKELTAMGGDINIEGVPQNINRELAETDRILREYTPLLTKLNGATNNVVKMTAQMGDVDKDVVAIQSGKHFIEELQMQAEDRQKAKEMANKTLEKLTAERERLFGSKDADFEEAAAAEFAEAAQQQKESCRGQKEVAERDFEQNKKDIARTQEYTTVQSRLLDVRYADSRISALEVCSAPCSGDEGIKGSFEEFCTASAGLGEAALQSADGYDGLIVVLNTLSLKETERQAIVGHILEANAQNIKEMSELKSGERKQEQTCAKWERLNALIGSAEGDKFSKIAQGYTFEVLLKYANNSLKKMTDQYVLVRDKSNSAKPLELCVMDNYQAGESRPVSNLSGGESFIVSMALALGMSEMSSGKTRIDSLFIDEGFASLDEDYLEAALQTLSSLGNREGKLVGVISHVGALRDRIDAQIEVKKLSGGRSTLSGPGVSVVGE